MAAGLAQADTRAAAFSGWGNPERGFCLGDSVAEARQCATEACLESGGRPVECLQTRTCRNAGWSMTVSITSPAGYDWEEFHCGYASQADALRMLPLFCRPARLKMVQACRISSLSDPDGKPVPIK